METPTIETRKTTPTSKPNAKRKAWAKRPKMEQAGLVYGVAMTVGEYRQRLDAAVADKADVVGVAPYRKVLVALRRAEVAALELAGEFAGHPSVNIED